MGKIELNLLALGRSRLTPLRSRDSYCSPCLPRVGSGDVKVAALIGMPLGWLGWDHIIAGVPAGMLLAAITAAFLIVGHRIGRRDPISLRPFLLAGSLLCLLA